MTKSSLLKEINEMVTEEITIMEVCGTHTHEIAKNGIHDLLSPLIKIQSGPGCPVCVTSSFYIDVAIEIAKKGAIIVTFGDMVAVKGTKYSLQDMKTEGYDIRILYSPHSLIDLCLNNKDQEIVFCGVGFETTAPVIAKVIKMVDDLQIKNVSFLLAIKKMEPILKKVLDNKNQKLDGLICPGHVASITGSDYFRFISDDYHITTVICGFEPIDLIGGIYYLVKNYKNGSFLNLYNRVVTNQGNLKAQSLINEIFSVDNDYWRGIGLVENSALKINNKYKEYDAINRYNIQLKVQLEDTSCICNEIIIGLKMPCDCNLFDKVCNPKNPYGPCMTSSEGACLAYYRYRRVYE